MPTEENSTILLLYFNSRIKQCKEFLKISAEALKNPVDINKSSMDEYVKRKNMETCGKDSILFLQKEFSDMKPLFIKLGYSEGILHEIEVQIIKC